jgi:hypothetical protein
MKSEIVRSPENSATFTGRLIHQIACDFSMRSSFCARKIILISAIAPVVARGPLRLAATHA